MAENFTRAHAIPQDDEVKCRYFGAAALLLVACARASEQHASAPRGAPYVEPHGEPYPPPPAAERGVASYYHDSLAGNPTASGEPYDPRALTAAHRKLPFGAVLDVVRDDGRAVRVRVNDRGPFVSGRVIDLSRAAAEALGMMQAGVVPVALHVVWLPAK